MATFFANILPYIALMWSCAFLFFTETIMTKILKKDGRYLKDESEDTVKDHHKANEADKKGIQRDNMDDTHSLMAFIAFIIAVIMICLPIRTIIYKFCL